MGFALAWQRRGLQGAGAGHPDALRQRPGRGFGGARRESMRTQVVLKWCHTILIVRLQMYSQELFHFTPDFGREI
jgi:hypothetical protein